MKHNLFIISAIIILLAAVLPSTAVYADSSDVSGYTIEAEPNNTYETGQMISLNKQVRGNLLDGQDMDVYTFDVGSDASVFLRTKYMADDVTCSPWIATIMKDDDGFPVLISEYSIPYFKQKGAITVSNEEVFLTPGRYYLIVESNYLAQGMKADYLMTVAAN